MAEDYERGRPDYPRKALELAGVEPGKGVLDLAAGTGKLTRAICAAGVAPVAVEPLAELRTRIKEAALVLDGTAECIPVVDASVDVAVVGDAWHWFDQAAAAEELARVVRPGGRVGLLWQTPRRDDSPDWLQGAWSSLRHIRRSHPAFDDPQALRAPLDTHAAFDGLVEHTVPFTWETDRATFLAFVASMSPVALMDEPERAELIGVVGGQLPDGPLEIPYETGVWTTRRS